MVHYNNQDTKNTAIEIKAGTSTVFIFSNSITTGEIVVRNIKGAIIYKKWNADASNIVEAIQKAYELS